MASIKVLDANFTPLVSSILLTQKQGLQNVINAVEYTQTA
jgi:hypothetical protein